MKKFIIKHGDTFFKISFWALIYLLTYVCIIFYAVIHYLFYCLGIQSEVIAEGISWKDCSFLLSLFIWLMGFTLLALFAHFIFSIHGIRKNVEIIVDPKKDNFKEEKENAKESCLFSLIDNVECPVIMPFVELFLLGKPFATFIVLIAVWIIKEKLIEFYDDIIKPALNHKNDDSVQSVQDSESKLYTSDYELNSSKKINSNSKIAEKQNKKENKKEDDSKKTNSSNFTYSKEQKAEIDEVKQEKEDLSQSISSLCKNIEEVDSDNDGKRDNKEENVPWASQTLLKKLFEK